MKYVVISFITYEGCRIKRHGEIYYWGKHYGSLEEIKKIIDDYIKRLQTT